MKKTTKPATIRYQDAGVNIDEAERGVGHIKQLVKDTLSPAVLTGIGSFGGGFHLKDTHHVDRTGDYRRRPDAEIMAPTTPRWFWEMGTADGLVDFPALFTAMKDLRFTGWVGVEHDKADLGGSNYPESTAISMWYARNVLGRIYA